MASVTKIEILIISVIVGILVLVGYGAYTDPKQEWPEQCYNGYLYKVSPEGQMHLRQQGKQWTAVKC